MIGETTDLAAFMEKNKPKSYEIREMPRADYDKIRRDSSIDYGKMLKIGYDMPSQYKDIKQDSYKPKLDYNSVLRGKYSLN